MQLTLDTGATSNMIRASSAKPSPQPPKWLVRLMDVIGEVHCSLTLRQRTIELDALVVRQLDVDILGSPQ